MKIKKSQLVEALSKQIAQSGGGMLSKTIQENVIKAVLKEAPTGTEAMDYKVQQFINFISNQYNQYFDDDINSATKPQWDGADNRQSNALKMMYKQGNQYIEYQEDTYEDY